MYVIVWFCARPPRLRSIRGNVYLLYQHYITIRTPSLQRWNRIDYVSFMRYSTLLFDMCAFLVALCYIDNVRLYRRSIYKKLSWCFGNANQWFCNQANIRYDNVGCNTLIDSVDSLNWHFQDIRTSYILRNDVTLHFLAINLRLCFLYP